MKRWLRLLAGTITVAACGFFVWHVIGSAREVGALVRGMPMMSIVPAFIESALLFVLIYPLTGSVFPMLLSSHSRLLARSTSIGILATSQLARYLPGNVGQHIARGGMLTARGFSMNAIVPALMIEAILSVMAACTVAGIALLLFTSKAPMPLGWPVLAGTLASGVIILTCVHAWPRIATRLGPRLSTLARSSLASPLVMMRCAAVYALNYISVGIGLYLVASAVSPDAGAPGTFIGAFALSWIVGFLAPGLPAGLGVREGVLVALLEPTMGTTAAVALAGLHRLSTTAGDALAATLGVGLLWRAGKVT